MTLREYLRKRIALLKGNLSDTNITRYEWERSNIAIRVMEEILSELSEFEHESDVERISDECKKAENCRKCPLCDEDGACVIHDEYPNYWELDDIKRRLKEARNDA